MCCRGDAETRVTIFSPVLFGGRGNYCLSSSSIWVTIINKGELMYSCKVCKNGFNEETSRFRLVCSVDCYKQLNAALEKEKIDQKNNWLRKKTSRKRKKSQHRINRFKKTVKDDSFFLSDVWRKLRFEALLKHGRACLCCGRSRATHNVTLHVDHIKPRYKYPELATDINNLQVLCEDCNLGKGALYETDFRKIKN